MSREAILKIFEEAGAFLEGHFLLTSGLHADHYIQCARILEDPKLTQRVVSELARPYSTTRVDWVVGPALGGIVLAYELGRALSAKAAFTERVDGKMELRRGFLIPPKSKVVVAEDVLTTGGSAVEVARHLESLGLEVIGIAVLADRAGVQLPYPKNALLTFKLSTAPAEQCTLCKEGIPLVKPGSRAPQPSH